MAYQKSHQNLLVGAAIAAGIVGALASLFGVKRKNNRWIDEIKAAHLLGSRDFLNKKMVLGGLTGGIIGAATALLLAPKAGADMIKDISRPFSRALRTALSKSKSAIRASTRRKSTQRSNTQTRSAKRHGSETHAPAKKRTRTASPRKPSTKNQAHTHSHSLTPTHFVHHRSHPL